jgi:type VI secretion system protein ImpA
MHPPFDPEDMSQRLRVLGGLTGNGSGSLLPPLRLIPLVEGSITDPPGTRDRPVPLSMFVYSQVKGIGKASLESATALVRAASDSYLRNSFDDVKQSRVELDKLEKTIAAKCEESSISAVSFEQIGRVLDEVADTYLEMGGGRISTSPAGATAASGSAGEPQQSTETGTPVRLQAGYSGATELKSRKQAIAEIRRLASYFESAEPQGVIGPALHRVASWGEMPLGDLLRTFVPEAEHRKMFSWLGIEPKPDPNGD